MYYHITLCTLIIKIHIVYITVMDNNTHNINHIYIYIQYTIILPICITVVSP